MALFSRNKKESTAVTADAVARTAAPTDRDLASVIIRPRVTEKSVGKSEQNVYTFMVRKDANKYDVRDAVKQLFNVTPVKINIVNKKPRQQESRSRNRVIPQPGYKKAYVYLKQGDSINLV